MGTNKHDFPRIRPGDVGFDAGTGVSGQVIRFGTKSAYGHCWIYHDLIDVLEDGTEVWDTVEAGPRNGVIHRLRTTPPNKVMRVWQNDFERKDLLQASEALVGARYGWGEIARIVARILGIKVRRWRDNPERVICSNHVTQAILAARPDFGLYLRYAPNEIWPGELAVTLDAFIWDTEVA
jgi:hypothetical protein